MGVLGIVLKTSSPESSHIETKQWLPRNKHEEANVTLNKKVGTLRLPTWRAGCLL